MASAPSTELNVMRRIERVASWLVSSGRSNERPSQVSSYSRSRVRSWSQCTCERRPPARHIRGCRSSSGPRGVGQWDGGS